MKSLVNGLGVVLVLKKKIREIFKSEQKILTLEPKLLDNPNM